MAQIFISYAREDLNQVRALYQKLKDEGFTPWMDKIDLIPGQKWQPALEHAVAEADFFILCLSSHSVKKRGFVQVETKNALKLWQQKLPGDIYFIPVLLEPLPYSEVPAEVNEFQWVELYEADGWDKLLRALRLGLEQHGITYEPPAPPAEKKISTPVSPPGIPSSPQPMLPLLTYNFATVTLDARGEVIERRQGQAKYFSENLGEGVKLEMVAVPGGSFYMGTSEADVADVKKEYDRYRAGDSRSLERELPQHKVNIPDFFIGRFPVRQEQWEVVALLPKINIDLEPDPSNFKGYRMPVEEVSWDEAQEFCARLARKTGRAYRLPSEAEWEYACRAGTMTPFAFGATITPEFVNYDGDYPYASAKKGGARWRTTPVGRTSAVGGFANAFGLYDMHGNVWEWCQDRWQENYNGAPDDGSAWERYQSEENEDRVVRGGAWSGTGWNCRSAYRMRNAPDERDQTTGFRVVMAVRTS